jgi:ubiquinone/menaquinone biosynthesis C-methylase UbiE
MNTDLIKYYKERAKEYESIYSKPERQHDLKKAKSILAQCFTGKEVLEIACGTGYWTETIAKTARSIIATDINEAVIAIAKQKEYPIAKLEFKVADIFTYRPEKKFQSLFAGFIWSHVKVQDLDHFLDTVHNFAAPGGTIVFMDNNYVPGSNHPINETDENGNTFQVRKLADGSDHYVLKNFPNQEFLIKKLAGRGSIVNYINLQYFWILIYSAK